MMSDVEEIFASLLDSQPSASSLTEANDRTIPTGVYRLDVVKKDMETASDKSPWPGRPMVKVGATASYKNGDGEYKNRGRIYFDLSPKEERMAKGNRQDGPTKLWLNLIQVVGKGATHRDALDYLGQYPLTARVTKSFRTLDGRWVNSTTEEADKKLIEEGAEPRNFVQSLSAFKG